jgi:PAS domain S-box-containing protein
MSGDRPNHHHRTIPENAPAVTGLSTADIYRMVADNSHDWEYWSSPDGEFIYCSPSCEQVIGIPHETYMKDYLAEVPLVHPDDLPLWMAHHEEMVASPAAHGEAEYRLVLGGAVRWIEHRCHPLFDDQGRFLGRRGSCRDITKRKQAEEALHRAQLILDRIGDMAFLNAGSDRFLYVNDAATRTFGYSREEFLGMTPRDLLADRAGFDWEAHAEEVRRRGSRTFEAMARAKDGRVFPIEVAVYVVNLEGVAHHCGFARDITDRKTAQEALRESEERFRAMAEAVPSILWATRPDGRSVYTNARAYEMTGLPAGSLTGTSWMEIVHPDDRALMLTRLEQATATGEAFETEYRLRSADSSWRWFVARAAAVRDAAGQITLWIGASTDIDDLKRAESDLRASEERFRAMAETVPGMLWATRPDGEAVYVNPRAYEISGLRPGALDGKEWLTIVHPDDRALTMERWEKAQVSGEFYETEYRLRTRDGAWRWFVARATPVRDAAGRITLWIGASTDIDDLKRADSNLRASEARFRALAETVPDILFTLEPDGHCDFVNQRAYEITGEPVGSLLGWQWAEAIHPDDRLRAAEEVRRAVAAGTHLHMEIRLRSVEGGYRWIVSRANPIRDADGRIVRWLGMATDVENLKRTQQALQEAHDRLEERVQARTADLEATNAALRAEIAERRRLEREVLRVSEFEQRRIGQDIHDGLCQQLAGITYLTQSLETEPCKDHRLMRSRLGKVRELLQKALADAREVAHGLSPLHLESGGLSDALRELARTTRKNHGIDCRFLCPRPVLVDDVARATHLYRIAQEAVHNSLKHGRAKTIRIGLRTANGVLRLRVEDSGRGLRKSGQVRHGLGLPSMGYRARALGGQFEIGKRPGGGVIVTCVAPLSGESTPAPPEAAAKRPRPRGARRVAAPARATRA